VHAAGVHRAIEGAPYAHCRFGRYRLDRRRGSIRADNGIFVGTRVFQGSGTSDVYWYQECSYLFPSGITTRKVGGWLTQVEAENEACQLFLLD